MQNNSIQTQGVNQEWLTIKEAAASLGIGRNSLSRWINNHPIVKSKFLEKRGKQFWLNRAFIPTYVSEKSLTGAKSTVSVQLAEAKQKMLEMAELSTELKRQNSLLLAELLPKIELIQKQQLELQQRFVSSTLPQIAAPIPPLTLRDQFRREVNIIHNRLRIPHSTIMGSVYERMYYSPYNINLRAQAENKGCAPIDILEDQDLFLSAIQILKEKYPDNSLF